MTQRQNRSDFRASPRPKYGRWSQWVGTCGLAALAGMAHAQQPTRVSGAGASTELEPEVKRFEEAAKEYRSTVQGIVRREYLEKRKEIELKYAERTQSAERDERERRLAAIRLHESFLAKYPNDTRWTPDVIFRLAELNFERSEDEFLVATEEYDKALQSGAAQVPPPPQKSYTRTIELYRRLIAEFPTYRLVDAAEYLLGYCYGEEGHDDEARQAYLGLVCGNKFKPLDPPTALKSEPASRERFARAETDDPYKDCKPVNPDSKFLPETWTRLGEYHFDSNELDLAIVAYRRVLQFKDSNLYDKALYKLAWSYYRADRFPEAIDQFDRLVVWSDSKKGESQREGSDLRPEAIQYLGISFSEEDWDGDTIPDAENGLARIAKYYKGREKEKHVREVYRKLADIYFDETKYDQAALAYQKVLEKWPYDPEAPKVQDRIITAYERQRNFAKSVEAREALARNFLKGTEWYNQNKNNPDALNQARDLAENSLLGAAIFHHKAAQTLKSQYAATRDPKLPQKIKEEYLVAADLYSKYLERFPNSKNAYEYGYYYAESLYYSEKFREAAEQYKKIRDSQLDNRYQEESAFSVIKSLEALVQTEIDNKKLVDPPIPDQANTKAPVAAKPIPASLTELQAAYDWYAKNLKSNRTSQIAYTSALISYKWLNWEGGGGARDRMAGIVDQHCQTAEGAKAGDALVMMSTIENNPEQIERWAKQLSQQNCGGGSLAQQKQGEYQVLLNDVRFLKAQKLFEAKNYEEAGPIYLALVNEAPKDKNADKALNNAAVCFENVHRYGEATKAFEQLYRDYPNSELAEEALFRAGVNHERFFEFQEAVSNYLVIAQSPKYKDSKHRVEALGLAAVLMERDQQYARAADLYKQYSAVQTKPDEAADAYFRAALVYEKMKDRGRQVATLEDFIKKYGSLKSAPVSTQIVQANYKLGEVAEQQRNLKVADQWYQKTVNEFSSRGLPPGGDGAEAAAHAAFILTERKLAGFKQLTFKTANAKSIQKSFDGLTTQAQALVKEYEKIWNYKRVTWSLAGFERMGDTYFEFSQKLVKSDVPEEIKKLERKNPGMGVIDQYREALDEKVHPVEKQAQDYWKKTLEKGVELGVANDWTTLARKNLNAYLPEEFPLIKEARVSLEVEGTR